jgi:hypothetical protein
MQYLQFSDFKYKGHRIVSYIGRDAPIDPEETRKRIAPIIAQSELTTKRVKLVKKKKKLTLYLYQLDVDARRKIGNKAAINELFARTKEELKKIEEKLRILAEQYDSELRDTMIEHAICAPPRNAALIDKGKESYWNNLIQKVKEDEILLETGAIIAKKQIEKERIASLSQEQKKLEIEVLLGEVMLKATMMRSQLEISGDKEALTKSQEWFRIEKAKIEKQYTS